MGDRAPEIDLIFARPLGGTFYRSGIHGDHGRASKSVRLHTSTYVSIHSGPTAYSTPQQPNTLPTAAPTPPTTSRTAHRPACTCVCACVCACVRACARMRACSSVSAYFKTIFSSFFVCDAPFGVQLTASIFRYLWHSCYEPSWFRKKDSVEGKNCNPEHMSLHMSIHMSVHMSLHMSAHMSIHMSAHMSAHMFIHTNCPTCTTQGRCRGSALAGCDSATCAQPAYGLVHRDA